MFSKGGPFKRGNHHLNVTDVGSPCGQSRSCCAITCVPHEQEALWYERVKRRLRPAPAGT
jgi:hypothetical protein